MPWHALTFDGLDDASFAEEASVPGTVVSVDQPLVDKMMKVINPHISKAVSDGVTQALEQHHKHMVIGGLALGGVAVAALVGIWTIAARLKECCPRSGLKGCDRG